MALATLARNDSFEALMNVTIQLQIEMDVIKRNIDDMFLIVMAAMIFCGFNNFEGGLKFFQ